jgi:hypothetical protein
MLEWTMGRILSVFSQDFSIRQAGGKDVKIISQLIRGSKKTGKDQRGIALIMVMLITSSLLLLGILFTGSVTSEYRAAVYYRQAVQSEQYCLSGLYRAVGEMMYDVWGCGENQPFVSARYSNIAPGAVTPDNNLQHLTKGTAYFDTGSGVFDELKQQRGFWNGESWVVWAGTKVPANGQLTWDMDPRPILKPELLGGALRYLSYGDVAGSIAAGNASIAVTGTGTSFDPTWVGQAIYLSGDLYQIATVGGPNALTLTSPTSMAYPAGSSWYVPGSYTLPPSGCGTLPGGTTTRGFFTSAGIGYGANPRWVNPAGFIKYGTSGAFEFGGVDLDGSGGVDALDKHLRDWALWQLKRDAFLPEAMDNTDLFEAAMHANNRKLWSNGTTVDEGWEFIDPKIIGDSIYQVFRFDPIYSLAPEVSGDVVGGNGLDGGVGTGKSDQVGYRFPYDRTHLNKWNTVAMADNPAGGLTNINQVNNNFNSEQWTNTPTGSPASCTWYHYNEAKWIYVYDPHDSTGQKRFGRYAVTAVSDNGLWNATALHSGLLSPMKANYSTNAVWSEGCVMAAGGYISAMIQGFNAQTGDDGTGSLLISKGYSLSPVRPDPLPAYWANFSTNPGSEGPNYYYSVDSSASLGAGVVSLANGSNNVVGTGTQFLSGPYFLNAGDRIVIAGQTYIATSVGGDTSAQVTVANPDPDYVDESYVLPDNVLDFERQDTGFPVVDYSRNAEIYGHGQASPWSSDISSYGTGGIRVSIYTYMIWLGPYNSRAEFATHMRKACLIYWVDNINNPSGQTYAVSDPLRLRQEDRDATESGLAKVASDAEMLANKTTVQGFYYTLDRFWDRDMLVLDRGRTYDTAATTHRNKDMNDSTDARFGMPQCSAKEPGNPANRLVTAAAAAGQGTRQAYLNRLYNLECFGGYRTRDGKYKLLSYFFNGDLDSDGNDDYVQYSLGASSVMGTSWGGGDNTKLQKRMTRIEKFMAMTTSRVACMQVSENGGAGSSVAACPRGHLLHNPYISSRHKSSYDGATNTKSFGHRTDPADETLDEIGEGCPVCGGKLVIAGIHEININEIGRFYGNLRNAERPVRTAFDPANPTVPADSDNPNDIKKPMRHFIELMCYGPGDNSCGSRTDSIVRYDGLVGSSAEASYYVLRPFILSDPVTLQPYFTDEYDYDRRYRMLSDYGDDSEAMDPEPGFKHVSRWSQMSYQGRDWRIYVYCDGPAGDNRWHDISRFENTSGSWIGTSTGDTFKEAELYGQYDASDNIVDGNYLFIYDDSSLNTADWLTINTGARYIRCDELYTMPDPDPAHQQAAAAANKNALVSIYRKMPVRWYGGERRWTFDLEYTRAVGYCNPPPMASASYKKPMPDFIERNRGLGFVFSGRGPSEQAGHSVRMGCMVYGPNPAGYTDAFYAGDNTWLGAATVVVSNLPSPVNYERTPRTRFWNCLDPRQYAVVSFDSRFDGSKVALVNDVPPYSSTYGFARHKTSTWRIIDYVELTDSVGTPIPISSCPTEGNTFLSWQARSPEDNRSNADGYTCWDLLPMSLQGVDPSGAIADRTIAASLGQAPTDNAYNRGFDPWDGGALTKWWGNASQGYFDGWKTPAPDVAFEARTGLDVVSTCPNVLNSQAAPPGYDDLRMEVTCRNTNTFFRDTPTRRNVFDGTTATSSRSNAARVEQHFGRIDQRSTSWGTRRPNRKECTMSIPTGIGRNVSAGQAGNTALATYGGRQYAGVIAGTWREGNGAVLLEHQWAGYSWNNWNDLYYVTDLCQNFLWDIYLTAEDRDIMDNDQNGQIDELTATGISYQHIVDIAGVPTVATVTGESGHFNSELKQINKVNLNELWYPPMFGGTGFNKQVYGYTSSYTTFGRKPLKGFHSPSDAMTYHFNGEASNDPPYNLRLKPWDLDHDNSEDSTADHYTDAPETARHSNRLDSSYTTNSTVYTFYVTGNVLDESDEPLAEMRAKATVERTWDGRINILEFVWLPSDSGFLQ